MRGKYNKVKPEERTLVCELKQKKRLPIAAIHSITGIKKKTISSINSTETKSPYKEFKRAVTQHVIESVEQLENLKDLQKKENEKELMKVIAKYIEEQQGENSKFKILIPEYRVGTPMRRIVQEMKKCIKKKIQIKHKQNQVDIATLEENNYLINNKDQFESFQNVDQEQQVENQYLDNYLIEYQYDLTPQLHPSPKQANRLCSMEIDRQKYLSYQINSEEQNQFQDENQKLG